MVRNTGAVPGGLSYDRAMRKLIYSLFAILFASQASAQKIEPAALTSLPAADVVVISEVHDNPVHHENQTLAVRVLQPAAIVFEMLTPAQAGRITQQNRKNQESLEAALGWNASGWPDFAMYYPIFAAAPEALIFGGALPRAEVRRAIKEGAAAVFGAEAPRFGLDLPLPEDEQTRRNTGQMEAHCNALPESLLSGMVESQRLRDAVLADAVLQARAASGGGLVVLITGNGHGRNDWGAPALLARAAPDLRILTIGQYEMDAPENPPFDLYLVTPKADRTDPCEAFKQG
jgi:uncharacterized iron-regulated protein